MQTLAMLSKKRLQTCSIVIAGIIKEDYHFAVPP